eukprot:gnl/Spiro4/21585_TR10566_c0_g2_i1.p1 gnl/Spiro4/21585_TR10566_c0_g2~~gnl/Spiro4/21585_TR10566_c0_g2_i1.p1  ORF type:complete len:451 (+),score=35.74 gnl/Spiro4/21585_TR10566_c0_g2_i1:1-1353(+)
MQSSSRKHEAEARELKEFRLIDAGIKSLSQIPNLSVMVKLSSLGLHSNRIDCISPITSNLYNLMELDLSSNMIQRIENLGSLSRLRVLNLSSNQLRTLEGLGGLFALRKLTLSYNKISSLGGIVDLHGPSYSLEHLDVNGNRLENLDEINFLVGCAHLRTLVFQMNKRANPLCIFPEYHTHVLSVLPSLCELDGVNLLGEAHARPAAGLIAPARTLASAPHPPLNSVMPAPAGCRRVVKTTASSEQPGKKEDSRVSCALAARPAAHDLANDSASNDSEQSGRDLAQWTKEQAQRSALKEMQEAAQRQTEQAARLEQQVKKREEQLADELSRRVREALEEHDAARQRADADNRARQEQLEFEVGQRVSAALAARDAEQKRERTLEEEISRRVAEVIKTALPQPQPQPPTLALPLPQGQPLPQQAVYAHRQPPPHHFGASEKPAPVDPCTLR